MMRFFADDRASIGRSSIRHKYILQAVLGYAIFSLIWIFLSDMLLAAFVDVQSIQWLSTAKGILYVLVTALMLYLMMRSVPDEDSGNVPTALLTSVISESRKLHRFMYVFAVLVTLAMLLVRERLALPFGERPLLILFMFPIIISAVVGGLGPGLVATSASALGLCYYAIPPLQNIFVEKPHDLFQLIFLVGNGVLVSIFSNVLHRLRRKSDEEKQLHLVTLESIGDGVIATDIRNRVTFINSEALRITGWSRQEALGQPLAEVFQVVNEHALSDVKSREESDAGADKETGDRQSLLRSRDGRDIPVTESKAKIQREDGTLLGEVLVVRDDTARRRAEAVLQESEERRRVLTDSSRDGIVIIDQEYRIFEANRRFIEMLGYSPEEVVGLSVRDIDALFSEQQIWQNLSDLTSAGMTFETRHRRKDGSTFAVEVSVSGTRWAGQQLVFCVCRDITARKQAEEENRKLELQLVQAQKMEAVGRLAGGVAHDFNNMLSVILGHAEIGLTQTRPDDPRYDDLQEIQKAAVRSTGLTRQLLAFARRQTVSPKVLDLNETVAGMLKMLRRLIGEDIDLLWLPGRELWHVKIDPSQIDQMLANLAVNARDAIGGVGKVIIGTANVTLSEEECRDRQSVAPGEYVVLTVSDTGTGMSRDVLNHIFEPFFTTKDVGKGTGLGLSTVFGIVKQNDGFVEVSSETGTGTVFRIYLPKCLAKPNPRAGDKPEKPPQGNETVLIVEDEPAILKLGSTILRRQGYTVFTAATPIEAMQVVSEHTDEIQLLITDVVMPEMNGKDLVERLRTRKPDLKCLYMSGYTADTIAHHGVLEEGVRFLQKPFSVLELTTQVRRAIDES